MGIGKILKSLFGISGQKSEAKDTSGYKISITTSNTAQPIMTSEEYAAYCEKNRKDPATKAWRSDPSKFQPNFEVSTDPFCPYCGSSLGNRKKPMRRSKISCKSCGEVIFVDPWHQIFPSVYLNARKGLIAKYLGMLDKGEATAGKTEDFWWSAQQKKWLRDKEKLTEGEAGDALWTLMNYNVMHMQDILLPEEQENYKYHSSELQNLMKQYREEEKEIKQAAKSKKKIELKCPYCEASLGQVAKPSRCSKRKCKSCSQTIYVDPHQKLFKNPFLTEKRQYLADTLAQLNHWVFTKGNIKEFNRVKKSLGKIGELSDDEIAEVIRALIVENIDHTRKQAEKEHQRYIQILGNDAQLKPDDTLPGMVEKVLTEFDKDIQNFKRSDGH